MGSLLDSINAQVRGGATADTLRVGSIKLHRPTGFGRVVGGIGTAIATGKVAGAVAAAAIATGGTNMRAIGTQLIASRGGSSGRSATPIVPTRATGVVPGILPPGTMTGKGGVLGTVIGEGLEWLRRRSSGGGTSLAACPSGSRRVGNACVDLAPGGDVSGGGMLLSTGEVVKGRYGAAEVPEMEDITMHRCRRGLVLGDDGLCYRKGDLRKDERKWKPGRKPLFTGGEQNAVATAARVAGRLQAHQSRLQRLGMLKKPKGRRQIELELRYAGKLRK